MPSAFFKAASRLPSGRGGEDWDPATDKKAEKLPVLAWWTPLTKESTESAESKASLLTSTTGAQPRDGLALGLPVLAVGLEVTELGAAVVGAVGALVPQR